MYSDYAYFNYVEHVSSKVHNLKYSDGKVPSDNGVGGNKGTLVRKLVKEIN